MTPPRASLAGASLKFAHLYVFEFEGFRRLFLTSWNEPLLITDLSEEMGGGSAEFTPAQIIHSEIEQSVGMDEKTTTITTAASNELLRKVFLTSSTTRVKAFIARINLPAKATSYDFEEDGYLLESGVVGVTGIQGLQIELSITPEIIAGGRSIPRRMFTRTCGKVFGQCGVNLDSLKVETTISAIDRATRKVTLATTEPFANYAGGTLFNTETGQRLTIEYGDNAAAGAVLTLRLRTWTPDLTIGDAVTIFPGCNLTIAECEKWANVANFGGFPTVPTINPVTAGG